MYVTNKDPSVIASYYLEAVKEYMGCPIVIRADPGTENVNVKQLQNAMMGNQRMVTIQHILKEVVLVINGLKIFGVI